ncbi:MAG: hypothetical protein LBU91_04600 [Bacteroidales bacterium]|jgi:hypothetical protein|nr:hypothetical protein [Bacteroidales bacterium]
MKTILKIAFLSLLSSPLLAQYDQDAFRLTSTTLSGNARFASMGGAFGALGGNLSALSTNPASIGIYRSGELSFTPALTIGQTKTKIDGEDKSRLGELWNFNLGNFGWVGVIDLSSSDAKDEWKKIQFGIGLNRKNDFWNRSQYSNHYSQQSYLEILTLEADSLGYTDDYYSGLAYDAGLIHGYYDYFEDEDGKIVDSMLRFGNYLNSPGGLTQDQVTKTTGGVNEWVFSMGGNYGDQLYVGATIGIPSLKYHQTKTLREGDAKNEHPGFWEKEWALREDLHLSGTGVNLKLGAIFKPADFIRIGLAFHTPTRFAIEERFSTEVEGNLEGKIERSKESISEYYVKTPARLIGSLGFVIGKVALIGVEYEHVNYKHMWLDDEFGTFDADNDYISEYYTKGGTLKIGAECRLEGISLRAGYNFSRNPYDESKMLTGGTDVATKATFSQQALSAGIGFQLGRSTTLDFAYVNSMRDYNEVPYAWQNINHYKTSEHQILVSLGFRF